MAGVVLTNYLWASALAQKLSDELGMSPGNMWIPAMAICLRCLIEKGQTREAIEIETRFNLDLRKEQKQ